MEPFTGLGLIGLLLLLGMANWPLRGDTVAAVADSFIEDTSPTGNEGGCLLVFVLSVLAIVLFPVAPYASAAILAVLLWIM
jgi:hypothetical protein